MQLAGKRSSYFGRMRSPTNLLGLRGDRVRECCKIVMDGAVHEDALSAVGFYPLIAFSKRSSHQAGGAAVVIGLVVILTAVTASLSLRLAEQFGRLSVPPLYDDVTYFLAAAQWLNDAPSHGIAASVYGLLQPTRTVLDSDRRYWTLLAPRRLSRTLRHQCSRDPSISARHCPSAVVAISRRYCDLLDRRGVRADAMADYDGSASRLAMGSRARIGHWGHSPCFNVAAGQSLASAYCVVSPPRSSLRLFPRPSHALDW